VIVGVQGRFTSLVIPKRCLNHGGVLLTGHGNFDKWEVRDDIPDPGPGSCDVLIRVGAAAVNNTDINTRTAWYRFRVFKVSRQVLPFSVPGFEHNRVSATPFFLRR